MVRFHKWRPFNLEHQKNVIFFCLLFSKSGRVFGIVILERWSKCCSFDWCICAVVLKPAAFVQHILDFPLKTYRLRHTLDWRLSCTMPFLVGVKATMKFDMITIKWKEKTGRTDVISNFSWYPRICISIYKVFLHVFHLQQFFFHPISYK